MTHERRQSSVAPPLTPVVRAVRSRTVLAVLLGIVWLAVGSALAVLVGITTAASIAPSLPFSPRYVSATSIVVAALGAGSATPFVVGRLLKAIPVSGPR